MKKYILLIFVSVLGLGLYAQNTFECRVTTGDEGYLYYQIKQTAGTTHPDATHYIGNITFAISWPYANSTVDALLICSGTNSDYFIEEEGAGKRSDGGNTIYYRKDANYSSNNFTPPTAWVNGTWYTIAKFEITDPSSGAENFSVYTGDGHNFSFDADASGSIDPSENYFPTVATGEGTVSSYPYPTVVYDYVWVGGGQPGFETNWFFGGNWNDACGAAPPVGPTVANNVYIPDVSGASGYFPNANLAGTMSCNNLFIGTGAQLTVPDVNGALNTSGNLENYGLLTINPNADATVMGSTHIENANGLVVEATSAGVGSFINDLGGPGTPITYGASGSAKVQTYVSNLASGTDFYMHLMGPTLDDATYTGPGTGADLSSFNVAPGNTYAYSWLEAGTGSWVNQSLLTYPVATTDGIGISTDDASSYTMEMTGALISGNLPTKALQNTGTHYELISNPYPSAIEFDAFQSSFANPSVIHPHYWIWDPSEPLGAGNYVPYSSTATPGSNIQVGQAFFVDVITPATPNFVTFHNINRAHSNVPFRDVVTNKLTLHIAGGGTWFGDRTIIHFYDGGTPNFEVELDVLKWNSMYEDATQIRSIAEDGTELSINTMPQLDLQAEMVSVPVNFDCGYAGEYTFTASDLESFEYGTEIWIEDKQDGNAWHHLSPGHEEYTFTAGADDPSDRFIVHFFGPTAIEENTVKNVLIYGDHEYALVRNMTNNEIVKEVYIYSLAGNMIMHKQVPEQNQYRFYVSNYDNYYVVKVVTDKNIYTEKVFIH